MRDFEILASQVHAQTTLDIELCRTYVREAFAELRDGRNWSWRLKRGLINIPAPYSTGTATFTEGDDTVLGTGTVWTSAMIGRQIRPSSDYPPFDIVDVVSDTELRISQQWAMPTLTDSGYSIFTAYVQVPEDCFSLLSVVCLDSSWRLNLNVERSMIDVWDARRSNSGYPACFAPLDYTAGYSGVVRSTVQVVGTGSRPTSHGNYTGVSDAIYLLEITATGAIDVATFRWRKNEGAWVDATCSSVGNSLSEGLTVGWPSTGGMTDGDMFVIPVQARSNPGIPRHEIYPYPTTQMSLPIHYVAAYGDIDDPLVNIPRYIPGYVIKEGALGRAARTAGDEQMPNPSAQIARAENHEDRFGMFLNDLARQDEEIFCRAVMNDMMPMAPLPWGGLYPNLPTQSYDPLWWYHSAV